tara:strand:+ start:5090 stop:5590 length:501 start_codon:yes stop_codon:yes gene_type:complete
MTFPALTPSARTFTAGNYPQTTQTALSGVTSGFRRGNRRINQTVSLSFIDLTETQLNLIKNHYIDRQGTFDYFFLSGEVWSGYGTPPIALLDAYAWRYASAPTISDGIIGRWSVDVELVSHGLDIGDLVFDGQAASATPARAYNVDGGSASATPARTYVINSGLAA